MRSEMARTWRLQAQVLARIADYLARLGPAQGPLAAKLGVRQQEISRLKRGDWKNPPLDVLDGVARAFGTTLVALLSEHAVDARPSWEVDLYAAVARLDEPAAEHVKWLLRREDARQGTARVESPPRSRQRTASKTTRKGGSGG